MGILNVTPDSFSDGGRYLEPEAALDHALEMQAEGAAIIDVGGESTRPSGARAVSAEVELNRVLPVIRKLAHKLDVPISVDTRKASVADAALAEGAAIVNDVSAMGDSDMAPVVARTGCALVLMHMRGGPEDHSSYAQYGDVAEEVARYLEERVRLALEEGIAPQNLILDPGIGFSKTGEHNLAILCSLDRFRALGYPLLIGASRKTFVRKICGGGEAEILFGTTAVNAMAVAAGASIIRVHDVAPAVAAMKMGAALRAAGGRC